MEKNSLSPISPLSPTLWPPDAFKAVPTIAAALGIALIYVGAAALIIVLLGISPKSLNRLSAGLVEVQLLLYVPIVAYIIAVVPRLGKRPMSAFGLEAYTSRDLLAGIIGAVAMFVVVTLAGIAQSALLHGEHEQFAIKLFEGAQPGPILFGFVAVTVIFAPFAEELVYRAFVFNALLRRMPFAYAAILSGIIFAASHGDKFAVVPLSFAGAILATVYYRTGSLWASMTTHGLFNAMGLLGVALAHGHKHV